MGDIIIPKEGWLMKEDLYQIYGFIDAGRPTDIHYNDDYNRAHHHHHHCAGAGAESARR